MSKFFPAVALSVATMTATVCSAAEPLPVDQIPEGTVVETSHSCFGIRMLMFGTYGGGEDGGVSEIVYGSDGDVWVAGFMISEEASYWIHGEKEGNKVNFQFPQPYCKIDGDIYNIEVYEQGIDSEGSVTISEYEPGNITFTITDTGDLTFDNPSLFAMLKFKGEWLGESQNTFFKANYDKIEVSDNIETSEWALLNSNPKYPVYDPKVKDIAIIGNEVYIKGIYESLPDSWIKGTIVGDKAIFPSGQYLGINNTQRKYCFFHGCDAVFNEDGYIVDFEGRDSFVFDYDKDKGILSADGEYYFIIFTPNTYEGQEFGMPMHDDSIMLVEQIDNPPFAAPTRPYIKYHSEIEPPEPDDPWGMTGQDYGSINFEIPSYDVNYQFMPSDELYYALYIDGELYTFSTDEGESYIKLEEPMTWFPYDFKLGWDINYWGTQHAITYYLPEYAGPYKSAGVQIMRKRGEEVAYSEIISFDIDSPVSVNTINSDEIITEEWYNLSGVKVSSDTPGLKIRRILTSDGRVSVSKVMVVR